MNQPDLFSPTTVVEFAQRNADKLSQEFLDWLPKNLHIWDAFQKETFKVIRMGFQHYSSRTIIEVLRHHTALTERDSQWKISNNVQPYLSRLFAAMYPLHAGLFEFKSTRKKMGVDHG